MARYVPPPASWLTALAVLWLQGPPAQAQQTAAVQNDIAYGTDPAQKLDLYTASGAGPHKLVVWVHGGGWWMGDKRGAIHLAEPLAAAGYTVAAIDYRMVPHTDVAGEMNDLALATAFLLGHAAQYGIDTNHFAVIGHSSGAHMAALLGADQSYLRHAGIDPNKLAVAISLDGIFDIKANVTHYPNAARPDVFGTDPQTWTRYSPIAHLGEMTAHPLFCPLHEDTNPRFVEQAALFEAALKQHGEHFMPAVAHGLNHGQLATEYNNPAQPMAGFVLDCLKKAMK